MKYFDKSNALSRIAENKEKIILELGCGNSKQFQNSIAIDLIDLNGVDIICDLNLGFPFIPDNSVDEIHSSHFMEHVSDFGFIIKEIYRILKPNGTNFMIIPHFSNPYFYSDYTHKNHFGLYSISYFSKSDYFTRRIPAFYNEIDFDIINIHITFKSRWIINRVLLKIFEKLINSNRKFQEYYEANLCYAIPAYELSFLINKRNV